MVSVWARQPESEAEVVAGGEGTSGGAVKRGLSVDAAAPAAAAATSAATTAAAGQDVKRFRTAAGAASAVSSAAFLPVAAHFICCASFGFP